MRPPTARTGMPGNVGALVPTDFIGAARLFSGVFFGVGGFFETGTRPNGFLEGEIEEK